MSVKIQTSLVNTTNEYQTYSESDNILIPNFEINQSFGDVDDYIEYFIYSLNEQLLYSEYDSSKYTPQQNNALGNTYSSITLDPQSDVNTFGIDRGSVIINYNFYKKLFNSSFSNRFWIKEISGTRTEIRITPQQLSNDELAILFQSFIVANSGQPYYYDFLLNFSNNKTVIVTNVLYDTDSDGNGSLLIKLYQPLPDEFDIKNTLWVVKRISSPLSYNVSFLIEQDIIPETTIPLKGPNFSVDINSQVSQTVGAYNYNDLFSTTLTSSFNQIKSLFDDKSYDINIDYSDFSNFVHFSSATDRVYNFQYKLQLIESYSADLTNLNTVVIGNQEYKTSGSTIIGNKISNIIEKFDGYEYYLYFETGSQAWPKVSTTKPYQLYSVTSSQAINWLGSVDIYTAGYNNKLFTANVYDNQNPDWVFHLVPEFIKDDSINRPYQLFLDMVAQHFDNIWVYYKDVSERFNANNDVNKGISKDVVSNALKALGVKLYTNTNVSDNIYYSLFGYNPNGQNTLPTGSEGITYYITSSLPLSSADDITTEYYKRIYHNIPYLLKTKGTERGLRALINCFGVPDTILRINEFGGYNTDTNTRYIVNRFSLAYENSPLQCITLPWDPSYYTYLLSGDANAVSGNSNIVPDTIEFRFKTKGIPTASYFYSQSLFQVGRDSTFKFGVNLIYNSTSSVPTSSYQNYGNASLYINGVNGVLKSTPIYLPFFDSNIWWSVMIKRQTGGYFVGQDPNTDNVYWLYTKGTILNEEGINTIAFEGSSSITIAGATQPSYNYSWMSFDAATCSTFQAFLGGTGSFSGSAHILAPTGSQFNGYFQELRYWNTPLNESAFNTHVLNSLSYVGNSISSSLFELIFRLPLGNNLNVPYQSADDQWLGVPQFQTNPKDYDLYDLGITTISSQAALTSYHPAVTGSFYIPAINAVYQNIGSFINGGTPFGYGLFSTNNSRSFVNQEFAELITSPVTGIADKVTNKVAVVNTVRLNISASNLLSPYVSSQIYPTNTLLSSNDIEVGFSPADQINEDIINHYGTFELAQYIGGTSDLYETRYANLELLSKEYFQKYLKKYNVSDLLRIIKYLDNSLFKFIKDFIPSRANTTAGIIIKPHILTRSKYKRVEPVAGEYDWSGSIDMIDISGSSAFGKVINTSYTASVLTPYGKLNIIRSNNQEMFTGEYSGSEMRMVDQLFTSYEVSSVVPINSQWNYVTSSLNYLLNNFTASQRSRNFYTLNYNYNQIIPTNYGVITQSINNTTGLNYNSLTIPFAVVQDYYYVLNRHIIPRYNGTKVSSLLYNDYTVGDNSYGNSAVIDITTDYFTYMIDVYTSSLTLPSRSNAQIKYLIDKNSSVIDLSNQNTNIFQIQNIFKSGTTVNLALFDTNNKASNLVDREIKLYEGGFKHFPIYYNLSGSDVNAGHSFVLREPITLTMTILGGYTSTTAKITPIDDPAWLMTSYIPTYTIPVDQSDSGNYRSTIKITRPAAAPTNVTVTAILRTSTITNEPDNAPQANCAQQCFGGGGNNFHSIGGYVNGSFSLNGSGWYELNSFPFVFSQGDVFKSLSISAPGCPESCHQLWSYGHYDGERTDGFFTVYDISLQANSTNGSPITSSVEYKTTEFVDNTCIDLTYSSGGTSTNDTIRFPASLSLYSSTDKEFTFKPLSDQQLYSSAIDANIDAVTRPFQIQPGDLIRFSPNMNFPSTTSLQMNTNGYGPKYKPGWDINEEYRIARVYYSGSIPGTVGYYLYAQLDRGVNLAVTTGSVGPSGSAAGIIPAKICKFVILNHVPDETNLVLDYHLTSENKSFPLEGMTYPHYISDLLREKSGNIIKSLKGDNLI